jgi:hypothetical protein
MWLNEYDEKDIVPIGLRCRNLLSFPPNPEGKNFFLIQTVQAHCKLTFNFF